MLQYMRNDERKHDSAIGAMKALKDAGYRIPETAADWIIQLIEEKNQQPLKIEVFTRLVRCKSV